MVATGLAVLAGCASAPGEQTEPTFAQVQALVEEQLSGKGCEFSVEDKSTDVLEDKTIRCLVTRKGVEQLHTIVQYERYLDPDEIPEYFAGLTTASHYFINENITVDPSGASVPGQPALDAKAFSEAVKAECDCGEVLTPE